MDSSRCFLGTRCDALPSNKITAVNDHPSFVLKSFFISAVNSAAVTISLLPQIEQWLRIASLLTAITYTVVITVKAIAKKKV